MIISKFCMSTNKLQPNIQINTNRCYCHINLLIIFETAVTLRGLTNCATGLMCIHYRFVFFSYISNTAVQTNDTDCTKHDLFLKNSVYKELYLMVCVCVSTTKQENFVL